MKKGIIIIMTALALSQNVCAVERTNRTEPLSSEVCFGNQANITFSNSSDYTMTLRILHQNGGYYTTVTLPPQSRRIVYFEKSGDFKIKIKAQYKGTVSYHDGGTFSVTNNGYQYTEGTIGFTMSTYGSGLGPRISAKEFESNY